MARTIAVIFAGGVGSRMSGADKPKQFLELGGEAIICHVIDRFEETPCVDGIVIVCIESWLDHLGQLLDQRGYSKVLVSIAGAETGQGSIFNGLSYIEKNGLADENTVVLIHDGVRPLIDCATISACAESARWNGPTATVAPVTETVVTVDEGKVVGVTDRSRCRLARAPQGFNFYELYGAHMRARKEGRCDFIDSISMMSEYGYEVFVVDGPEENIKITTPRDFLTFKGFVDLKEYEQIWR
ncbi:IspD/TarI family cytidylyltransferase [Paratractidigestivibacter sp.]|uniref:IspD/TarI family cytidylyltransferase n=1 Tax=Paratractidigestivibacter sp. TaxID=2847316 RepID=UPI002ACB11C9|nr:IspD/TarI family cytidylyltransferase [Paratractidigestivibacter sp.]